MRVTSLRARKAYRRAAAEFNETSLASRRVAVNPGFGALLDFGRAAPIRFASERHPR